LTNGDVKCYALPYEEEDCFGDGLPLINVL